ncbi:MAG: hypothetical protein MK137_08015 [Rickettsiales bacterium]|nr:hypothetical protein [Rickettsiales bacterium]
MSLLRMLLVGMMVSYYLMPAQSYSKQHPTNLSSTILENNRKINGAICSSLGFSRTSTKFKTCVQERMEYDQCVINNKEKTSEFTLPNEEVCKNKAVVLFPDSLSLQNERNVVVKYSQNEKYKININDEPQYTQDQLLELRTQFISRCIQEREHTEEYVTKTKQNCSRLLELSNAL